MEVLVISGILALESHIRSYFKDVSRDRSCSLLYDGLSNNLLVLLVPKTTLKTVLSSVGCAHLAELHKSLCGGNGHTIVLSRKVAIPEDDYLQLRIYTDSSPDRFLSEESCQLKSRIKDLNLIIGILETSLSKKIRDSHSDKSYVLSKEGVISEI